MTDPSVLPNPFMVAEADVLLELLERRLAGATPLSFDPAFMKRLEYAIGTAVRTPERDRRARHLVARLRELAR